MKLFCIIILAVSAAQAGEINLGIKAQELALLT